MLKKKSERKGQSTKRIILLLLCEGEYTSRLETLADIPRGICIYWFEKVDWTRAKEILGYRACIRGGVPPPSLLFSGTVDQVKARVKEIIDVAGKGGGLMIDSGIWFDEARREKCKSNDRFHQRVRGFPLTSKN